MSNHTPGPWAENACEIQAQDGSPICEMLAWPEDSGVNYPYSPVADANARLITAAPELLDLAREVAGFAETITALLCTPGEATKAELVSAITDLGARAAALVNDAVKEEA